VFGSALGKSGDVSNFQGTNLKEVDATYVATNRGGELRIMGAGQSVWFIGVVIVWYTFF